MRRISLIVIFLVFALAASVATGCGNSDDSQVKKATDIVDSWTSENMTKIAEDVAAAIISELPVTNSSDNSLVQDQTKDFLSLNYDGAEKKSDNLYNVVLHTYVMIDIPQTGSYEIYVDFDLTVNTLTNEVTSSNIDLNTFDAVRE